MTDRNAFTERLAASALPAWEEIPNLDLYMDQVLSLLERYLGPVHAAGGKGITAAMVNNYVKQGVMPAPVKKRYTRIHLVYLIMIDILKPALTMVQIRSLLETELSKRSLEDLYGAFRACFRAAAEEAAAKYREEALCGLSVSGTAAVRAYVEQAVSAASCPPVTAPQEKTRRKQA